jgi:hypothetical protein
MLDGKPIRDNIVKKEVPHQRGRRLLAKPAFFLVF